MSTATITENSIIESIKNHPLYNDNILIGNIDISYNSMGIINQIMNSNCKNESPVILHYAVTEKYLFLATTAENIKAIPYLKDYSYTYRILKTKLYTSMNQAELYKFFTDELFGFDFSRKIASQVLKLI